MVPHRGPKPGVVLGDLDLAGGQAGIADRHHRYLSVKFAHNLREHRLVESVAESGKTRMHLRPGSGLSNGSSEGSDMRQPDIGGAIGPIVFVGRPEGLAIGRIEYRRAVIERR